MHEPLAKLFVLRITLSGTTSFIAYLLVNLHKSTCSVGPSRHGAAEGEDGRTEIRQFCKRLAYFGFHSEIWLFPENLIPKPLKPASCGMLV